MKLRFASWLGSDENVSCGFILTFCSCWIAICLIKPHIPCSCSPLLILIYWFYWVVDFVEFYFGLPSLMEFYWVTKVVHDWHLVESPSPISVLAFQLFYYFVLWNDVLPLIFESSTIFLGWIFDQDICLTKALNLFFLFLFIFYPLPNYCCGYCQLMEKNCIDSIDFIFALFDNALSPFIHLHI